jgi:hypothetical protein
MNNKFLADVCGVKYLDFSVPLGKYPSVAGQFVNDLDLEYGCTYNFTVLYKGKPLTKKSVPFYPIKLIFKRDIIDFNNCIDLKNFDMYKINNTEILSRVLRDIIINKINTMIHESDLIDNYYNHVIN